MLKQFVFGCSVLVFPVIAFFYRVPVRTVRADVILPTPTANPTKVAPRLKVAGIQLNYLQGQQVVIYQIYGTDGKVVSESRQGVAFSPTPAAYITQARVAFERALAGSTPISGITPVGKGSVTP